MRSHSPSTHLVLWFVLSSALARPSKSGKVWSWHPEWSQASLCFWVSLHTCGPVFSVGGVGSSHGRHTRAGVEGPDWLGAATSALLGAAHKGVAGQGTPEAGWFRGPAARWWSSFLLITGKAETFPTSGVWVSSLTFLASFSTGLCFMTGRSPLYPLGSRPCWFYV